MTRKVRISAQRCAPALPPPILLAWQGICSIFQISEFIFPSSFAIGESMLECAGPIAGHAWHTCWVSMAGFALAVVIAVLLGLAIGSSPFLYKAA